MYTVYPDLTAKNSDTTIKLESDSISCGAEVIANRRSS